MRKLLPLILAGFFILGCANHESSSGSIVARVNGTAITEEDFLRELSNIPEWARGNIQGKAGKERFLQEMINKEMVYQDAVGKGLLNDRELAVRVEEFRKMTLLALILKQEIEDKARVTEVEMKEYYEDHVDDYSKNGVKMDFSEAKVHIEKQILKSKQKELFDSYLNDLRDRSEVKTDDEALASINLPWEKPE
jgi:hypothetical protein